MNTIDSFRRCQDEAFELIKQKNKDYGNAFEDFGIIGILIRINDKIKRAMSITSTNVTLVNTESLRDTLIDLHNYAGLAVIELDKVSKKD